MSSVSAAFTTSRGISPTATASAVPLEPSPGGRGHVPSCLRQSVVTGGTEGPFLTPVPRPVWSWAT